MWVVKVFERGGGGGGGGGGGRERERLLSSLLSGLYYRYIDVLWIGI